ncbi:MAG: gliding motility-associated C-terminal domain-containing protein, partial [Flavobacteriia bacterium]
IILSVVGNLLANATIVQPTCGVTNGSIAFNPTPAGSHTFSWSHDLALTSSSAANLANGTYDVSITLGACSKDTTINLAPSALFNINGSITQPVTCAQNDGQISLNPQPNGSYTFTWQHDSNNSTNTANTLTDGTYLVTVSDGTCSKDTSIVLAAPTGCCTIVLAATTSVTDNTVCDGTSNPCNYSGPTILINEINIFPTNGDGSIYGDGPGGPGSGAGEWIELYNPDWCNSIDISGYILGSFNSTFSLNPPLQSDGMGFVLPAGTIVPPNGFVVVRGVNTAAPPVGVIDIIVDNVDNRLCIEGGLIDSRMWFQNAGGWFGFYDANGVPQDMIMWNAPTPSDLDGRPCIPTNNNLPGGVTQLATYNEAGINNTLGAPTQGQTFVRIPDGGSWSSTTQNENSTYGTCNVPGGCGGNGGATSTCNGTATLNLTNGQAPFTYQWNDDLAQITQNADSLCSGNYSVAVTDANGCNATFNVVIDDNFLTIAATSNDPSCSNNDGTINVVASPNGTYDYTWSANANVGNTTTSTVNTLASGTYTITVSSPTCTRDTTITLLAPPAITDIANTVTNSTCAQNNGSILLGNVTGGTQPFTYNFNNQGNNTNTNFTNLFAGNYVVIVQDANGCSYQESIVLIDNSSNPPTDATFTLLNPGCGQTNGEIEVLNVTGGQAPYSYQINNGAVTSNTIYSNLGLGTYSFVIEDANGCSLDTVLILNSAIGSEKIIIPNIFTPSDDQINQVWKVSGECIDNFECQIFNRWGNLIHEYKDINGEWDGNTDGTPVVEGVYFYKVKVTFNSGTIQDFHGNITVIRD